MATENPQTNTMIVPSKPPFHHLWWIFQQRYRRVTPNHHSGLDIRLPRLHVDGGGLPEPAVALQRAGQGNATHNGRVNL